MSQEDTQEEIQTLGAFLREHREQKGASLADVSEETKISLPVLTAIEEDNYEHMPAVAFCRGFYSIYANYLELDAEKILEQYSQNVAQGGKSPKRVVRPPVRKSQSFSSYAEPSSISPAAGKSVFLMLCIIAIVGVCFYFNWNPLDYLNDKLAPPSSTPIQQEQNPNESQLHDALNTEDAAIPQEEKSPSEMSSSSLNSATDQAQSTPKGQVTIAPYNLEIDFHNDGALKLTLDDGFILDKQFTAGTSQQYQVKKKIILDMPKTIEGKLRLNGIDIPLPKVVNGRRRLSLPEDLLD
jgi:cytoskeleton protein RodZ